MLCSAGAQFVLTHDRRRSFRLATAQSDFGKSVYREHGLDPDAMTTMIVILDGRPLFESDAVLAVLGEIGWPWRAALVARIVPRTLRNWVYRLIARNRYRWIGERTTCWIPTPDLADRMLYSGQQDRALPGRSGE